MLYYNYSHLIELINIRILFYNLYWYVLTQHMCC